MPFSANSPEGPVSLIGVDPASVEAMRSRNRKAHSYTAKCCGAPLSIRVAPGKAPHFVHQVTPENCEGDRRETSEHRRLKLAVADAAIRTYQWEVETEARESDEAGRTLWQADVLARRRKAAVAFEVQLSNADHSAMLERQRRYRASGVRGLWFVRTRKGFPPSMELPVFVVESNDTEDWVDLSTRWDFADVWRRPEPVESLELSEFVEAALDGKLRWAPFERQVDTVLQASVAYNPLGPCTRCGRTLIQAESTSARILGVEDYPDFFWHVAMGPQRRTKWHAAAVRTLCLHDPSLGEVAFNVNGRCSHCRSSSSATPKRTQSKGSLEGNIRLGDLPPLTVGTVEAAWLRRWVVLGLL